MLPLTVSISPPPGSVFIGVDTDLTDMADRSYLSALMATGISDFFGRNVASGEVENKSMAPTTKVIRVVSSGLALRVGLSRADFRRC
ncbi:hypothetical protein D9758_000518 [Tetrapyrgos nigripes]|uniref:Uncharacterized protein n=1 Tax=Tetrapyrgos nigripes TaxID=182062 RepID=A0A8H5H200_9AGAR|nr:hypothetical protein D9758_000518 [Tetrapyrgos nigripes]